MGYAALDASTTGADNTAIGYNALTAASTSGSYNTAVGKDSLEGNTTGTFNTGVGQRSGESITTATKNTMIGNYTGASLTTGDYNLCIGSDTNVSASNGTYQFVLGYSTTAYGNSSFTVGETTTDSYMALGGTSWSAISDRRYKKDIETAKAGLDFINDLRPVTYRWKTKGEIPSDSRHYEENSDEIFRDDKHNHGFIAQEVKEAMDNHADIKDGFKMWNEADDGFQDIADGYLVPMLVKAIQELSAQVEELKSKIEE
jgi:hypothetical protein